jgi:hypothetical protein
MEPWNWDPVGKQKSHKIAALIPEANKYFKDVAFNTDSFFDTKEVHERPVCHKHKRLDCILRQHRKKHENRNPVERNETSKNRDSENQRLHCTPKNEGNRFAELIRNSLPRKELFTFSSNRKVQGGGMSENWERRAGSSIACSKIVKAMWLPPSWRNVLWCRVRGHTHPQTEK